MGVVSLWGFGGVNFTTATESVEFPHGIGQVTYKKVAIKAENINREIVEKFLGYRVTISVELTNIHENDYTLFRTLFAMINSGDAITIFPRGADGIWITDVLLDSDVTFTDLHLLEIGQTLKLKFINKDLVLNLSTFANVDDSSNLTDENSIDITDENSIIITAVNY